MWVQREENVCVDCHVWNEPYLFVPHDFYLWLTIKNLFTPFKSTQEWKDLAEKAWAAGLKWTKGMTDFSLGQSRLFFDLWWGHWLGYQWNLYLFG